jgi:hypothetical protein
LVIWESLKAFKNFIVGKTEFSYLRILISMKNIKIGLTSWVSDFWVQTKIYMNTLYQMKVRLTKSEKDMVGKPWLSTKLPPMRARRLLKFRLLRIMHKT